MDPETKTIELKRPVTISGAKVERLTMREPTVGDQIDAQNATKSAADGEVLLIANLCEISPDDVRGLTMRDYRALQAALAGFIG